MSEEKQPRKASRVRHTRAIQQKRSKQPVAAPSDQQLKERIQEIVHPATLAQVSYFHQLGLRERTLSFVTMVAFVLEMIWRQIGRVSALTWLIQKEAILWEQPRKVSQQALTATPNEFAIGTISQSIAENSTRHARTLEETRAPVAA